MLNKKEMHILKTDASPQNIQVIRKFIEIEMKKNKFSKEKISAMKVSVTEHCENIIKHSYNGNAGKMEIYMEFKKTYVKISVVDFGPKFDMNRYSIPDTSRRLKKGLGGKMGIKTILAMSDKVIYKRKRNYNENIFIIKK